MTRLLWHSNSPLVPTGYGVQTGLFAPMLNEHYDVAISAFYGLEGSPIKWKDIPILPGLGGEFGNEYILEHARRWFEGDYRDGLLLTLMDIWVMDPRILSQMSTAAWVPVDHEPPPPKVINWFRESGAVPLAMSRFGEEQLAEFDPIYVPHGIDTDVYKPTDQSAVRRMTGVPEDAFVVGMVAANKGRPSRKGFQSAFEAFRFFRERHENAYLYLHTVLTPKWAEGESLKLLFESLEIPEESILVADQYQMMFEPYPPGTMAQIYAAMDVLLNPSTGEGFGVPIMEAAACGVPTIGTQFSAMPETIGPGWLVTGRPWWTPHNSWMSWADVGQLVDRLEECYQLDDSARKSLSKRCRTHALNYSAKKVFDEHLLPALREIEDRLGTVPEGVAA
jgi:glycosyltransferase involved in cell wall biosynthesis